jgi:predicted TIM-barrel fold metal-dependent hydrolase
MVQRAKIIDFHTHYSPPEFLQETEDKVVRYVDGVPSSTVLKKIGQWDKLLQTMDQAGVDISVISSPEGMKGDLDRCRIVNDRLHEAMKRYSGRIIGMANTDPLAGGEGLSELERAVRTLGLKGVVVPSTLKGKSLDDPLLWPFYEKVQQLDTFLFVHPALASPSLGLQGFDKYDLYRTVGREFDLVLATIRLICGGVLDDFPKLKIVISHFGGGISPLLGRIKNYQDKAFWGLANDPIHGRTAKEPFESYIPRMYYDTGGNFGDITSLQAALLNISADRLFFGTDYPQEIREGKDIGRFITELRSLPLSEGQADNILGGNAAALLGLGS